MNRTLKKHIPNPSQEGNPIPLLRRVRRVFPFLYILFIAIVCNSCDIFTTRTPQPPDLGSTFIWTPAAIPSNLVDNFKGTIEALDATNYAKCFIGAKDSSVTGTNY